MVENFNIEKAKDFIFDKDFPYVQLLYKREIKGIKIDDSEFLELQEELLSEKLLARLMNKQLENRAWQPSEKDEVFTPMQKSTLWTIIQLGEIGLNVQVYPISKKQSIIFSKRNLIMRKVISTTITLSGEHSCNHIIPLFYEH